MEGTPPNNRFLKNHQKPANLDKGIFGDALFRSNNSYILWLPVIPAVVSNLLIMFFLWCFLHFHISCIQSFSILPICFWVRYSVSQNLIGFISENKGINPKDFVWFTKETGTISLFEIRYVANSMDSYLFTHSFQKIPTKSNRFNVFCQVRQVSQIR